MRIVYTVFLLMIFGGAAALARPLASTTAQYTRIELPAANASTFQVLRGNGKETTLVIEKVVPSTLQALTGFSDHRVAAVSVKSLGIDRAEVVLTLTEPGIDSFAYLQGGTVVVDLWKQEGRKASAEPTPVKAQLAKKTPEKRAQRAPAEIKPKEKPASVAFLSTDRDLFEKFVVPMPELKAADPKLVFSLPPRVDLENWWKFADAAAGLPEAQGDRFAKKLMQEKSYGLVIKAIEIQLRDFPSSALVPEWKLLQAFAYKLLGEKTKTDLLRERADKIFETLAAERRDNGLPLPFHKMIRTYFGAKAIAAKDWLRAIDHFEYVSKATMATEPEFPYYQMLLADAYAKVNEPRKAERLYRFVEEKFPSHALAAEAAYRSAILLGLEKNYRRTIELAEHALEKFPTHQKNRPEAVFHLAEAYFAERNYAKSRSLFTKFIELSASSPNSALAYTRLGEIAEMHESNVVKARSSYLAAKNGFPFTHGEIVSTARQARLDLYSEPEPQYIVKKLEQYLQSGEISTSLRQMIELVLVDYKLLLGEYGGAIQIAHAGITNTSGPAYEAYKRAYQKALYSKLGMLNQQKKYPDALALFNEHRKWFEQYGADSYREIAKTYQGLGLYSTANEFTDKYAQASRTRGPASVAVGEVALLKAENFFAQGKYPEALAHMTKGSSERELYLRAIAEFRSRSLNDSYRSAEKAVEWVRAHREKSALTDREIEELAEVLLHRAQNERDYARAETDASAALALIKGDSEYLQYEVAAALWYQKKHAAAVEKYSAVLAKFPKSPKADMGKYQLGLSYLALKRRQDAVKFLTEVRDGGKSVWAESARQELELIEWETKYSSVLKTLPPSGLGIVN